MLNLRLMEVLGELVAGEPASGQGLEETHTFFTLHVYYPL